MFGFRSLLGKLHEAVSRVLPVRRQPDATTHTQSEICNLKSEICNPPHRSSTNKPPPPTPTPLKSAICNLQSNHSPKTSEKPSHRQTKSERLSAFNSLREAILSAYTNLLYSPKRISRVVSSLRSLRIANFKNNKNPDLSVETLVSSLERDLNAASSANQIESAIASSGLSPARFFLVLDQAFPPETSSSGQFKSVRAALDRVIQIRNEIVLANYGLVGNIISRYFDAYPFDVQEDLRQVAAFALSRAVLSYSPSSSNQFSSFASVAILNELNREISRHNDLVSIPVNAHSLLGKLSKIRSELEISLGRPPTDEELRREFKNLTPNCKYAFATLRSMSAAQHVSSLDAPVSPDSSSGPDTDAASRIDFLEDPSAPDPSSSTEAFNIRQFVSFLISQAKLTKRDLLILDASFGLSSRKPMTNIEIAKSFHLSRERVRQLLSKALEKIKSFVQLHPELSDSYSQFVSNYTQPSAPKNNQKSTHSTSSPHSPRSVPPPVASLISRLNLSPRQALVFDHRLGLSSGSPASFSSIAIELKLSRQRIAQIFSSILNKSRKLTSDNPNLQSQFLQFVSECQNNSLFPSSPPA